MQGKFIVFEGTDGSGKRTQTEILVKNLQKAGFKVKTIDFPQYENNFFGKFVGECLAGEHGDFAKLDPKIASVLYAADRFESSEKIKNWLNEGYFVVADRYANSNQIHQGGKILNDEKRREFLQWLEKMEFGIFKISKPDLIVFLNVSLNFSLQLLENKDSQDKKKYLHGKRDAHESDLHHLENAKKSALKLVKESADWVEIECVENGELLGKEVIGDLVWEKVGESLKIKFILKTT